MIPIRDPRPWLPVSEATSRRLHRLTLGWSLVTILGLVVARQTGVVPHQPGALAFDLQVLPVLIVLFVVGVLLAWRWPAVGGAVAGFTAAGLMVFATALVEPPWSWLSVAALALPGLVWVVLDLHDLRRPVALAAVAIIAVAVASGALLASAVYDRTFGPTHPASAAPDLSDAPVSWVWSGGVTTSEATVVARVDADGPVGLVVTDANGSTEVARTEATPDDHGVVRLSVAGLSADVAHRAVLVVDGDPVDERAVAFRTFPDGAADFVVAFGGCARVGSNGAVFDAIAAEDPLLYGILGDFHYANIGDDDPHEFRRVLDRTLSQPGQSSLYASTPVAYVWDDHDFGADNADGTSASRPAAMEVYREYVPHYPLAGPDSTIEQAFTIGRVRFLMTDGRSASTPPDAAEPTMLGEDQLRWLERELVAAADTHPLIVWMNPVPWIAEPGGDGWGAYPEERARIAAVVAEHDIDQLVMVSGDAHMVALDDGTNSDYSGTGRDGFPVLHVAALDRPGSVKGGPYSEGTFPGGGQYGRLEVDDDGERIVVTLSGHTWDGQVLVKGTFTFETGTIGSGVS